MSRSTPSHISQDAGLENPFWRYSLDVYSRASVRDACLSFQERYGGDVNILLFLCWRAKNGFEPPSAPVLAQMIKAIAPLNRRVIGPLRAARDWLKAEELPGAAACRKQVLTAELAGEQMAQALLFERFGMSDQSQEATGAVRQSAHDSLEMYLQQIGLAEDAFKEAHCLAQTLVKALFDPDQG